LRTWYAHQARDLPWRRTRDPYHVWVSEVMLQQTQVQTVIPYFERFCKAFPTLSALAAADEQQVLQLWEGLGYYRRGRQLHAAARVLVETNGGAIPRSRSALEKLPGIGRYTAAAILSIAFDVREAILEANTIRLFARLAALPLETTTAQAQKQLWAISEGVLPRKEVGLFNQALMELGSLLCTPQSPQCSVCPVADLCLANRKSVQHKIPVLKRRPPVEKIREAAVVISRRKQILLRHCGPKERWSGLWDFPRMQIQPSRKWPAEEQIGEAVRDLTGYSVCLGPRFKRMTHAVTRYQITLDCYEAKLVSTRRKSGNRESLRWVSLEELNDMPLSITGRRIAQQLIEDSRADT